MTLRQLGRIVRDLGIDFKSLDRFQGDRKIVVVNVAGGETTLNAWQKLRSALDQTGRWPIVLGEPSEEMEYFDEVCDDWESPAKILKRVPKGRALDSLRAHRRREEEGLDELLGRKGDAQAKGRRRPLRQSDERTIEIPDELKKAADWPEIPPEHDLVPQAATDILEDEKPYEQCMIALLPMARPEEAPAYLRFGGFNDCPPPEIHVAMLRDWSKRYGAVPISITHDFIECMVARPPRTPDDARLLAFEQYEYCGDIVEQGTETIDALAVELWQSPMWYFWWD